MMKKLLLIFLCFVCFIPLASGQGYKISSQSSVGLERRSDGLDVFRYEFDLVFDPPEHPPFFINTGLRLYPDTAIPECSFGFYYIWPAGLYSQMSYTFSLPISRNLLDSENILHSLSVDLTKEFERTVISGNARIYYTNQNISFLLMAYGKLMGENIHGVIRLNGKYGSLEKLGGGGEISASLFPLEKWGLESGISMGTYKREGQSDLTGFSLAGYLSVIRRLPQGPISYRFELSRNSDTWARTHVFSLAVSP